MNTDFYSVEPPNKPNNRFAIKYLRLSISVSFRVIPWLNTSLVYKNADNEVTFWF